MRKQLQLVFGSSRMSLLAATGWFAYDTQQEVSPTFEQTEQAIDEADQDQAPTQPDTPTTYTTKKGLTFEAIIVFDRDGDTLDVTGKVPGSWLFEANFSYDLLDFQGTVVSSGPIMVEGDWQTTQPVLFTVDIDTSKLEKPFTVRFQNDNPSGLEEHSDSLEIAIK